MGGVAKTVGGALDVVVSILYLLSVRRAVTGARLIQHTATDVRAIVPSLSFEKMDVVFNVEQLLQEAPHAGGTPRAL